MTKVEEFTFGNPTPVATSTYRYDGLGRRVEKIGNGQTRRYIYDGEDIFLEYDQTNTLLARYTHGPGIDEPVAVTRGGVNYYYHQDGLGTVTELTDSAGATVKAYTYDAYGNILQQTGAVENPYTYTGREFDAETGLYYYRARQYDPITGRFLQKDPSLILDDRLRPDGLFSFRSSLTRPNELHAYAYVQNNPVNYSDPTGLEAAQCPLCPRDSRKCIVTCLSIAGTVFYCVEIACKEIKPLGIFVIGGIVRPFIIRCDEWDKLTRNPAPNQS